MMKWNACLAILATASVVSAADLAFQKGTHAIGVGANLDFGRGFGAAVAWDMGAINNMFSFGAEMKFSADNEEYFGYEWTATYISPEFRFAFHPFGIPALDGKVAVADKLDAYVVAHTGPSFQKVKYEGDFDKDLFSDYNETYYNFGTAVGVRYFFTDMFGVWGEVDWDRTLIGVNFKF